jgi:hypothetical protein
MERIVRLSYVSDKLTKDSKIDDIVLQKSFHIISGDQEVMTGFQKLQLAIQKMFS